MFGNRDRNFVVLKFTSAVFTQVIISAANLAVGLILIRRTSMAEYGHYVLVTYALLLAVAIQYSYIQPAMVIRLTEADTAGGAEIVGGLLRGQRYVSYCVATVAIVLIAILWAVGAIDTHTALLVVAGTAAVCAAMYREFFRMVLLSYHRSTDVLKSDAYYVVALVFGALLATTFRYPAIVAVVTLSIAAVLGGTLQSRALWRYHPWNPLGNRRILLDVAPMGTWSTAGSCLHWGFSQGYNYLAAGTLSVAAVGALASTRLLLTPLNLVSAGIGSLMLPTVSKWLQERGRATAFRRLLLISISMAGAATFYVGIMWLNRDWIVATVFKKEVEHLDVLLLTWSAVFLLMLFRDQLLQLPQALGLFRPMMFITLVSTIVALTTSYLAMIHFGVVGVPMGVLIGELFNLTGIIFLSVKHVGLANILGNKTTIKISDTKLP